jgi:dTDP-4-amino-4,6-dideoxygalactose transaminase
MIEQVPFNRAAVVGREHEYMAAAVANGHISGDGPFTRKCQQFLEEELGVAKALLTTSCTHALDMTAMLLDFQPGDEVILPSFTFVSSVNAFVLRGAKPAFADIRPDTLNIDEQLIERLITPRTKAVVTVHYAGVGCRMDVILEIARRGGIAVIEDDAHGLFGKYQGRPLGSFGRMATVSFHETKNLTCGEGGALLISDTSLIERAEILREKGTNRSRFFRGQVDKYTWVDIGSSYLPSDILAAYLYGQIERKQDIQAKRKLVWNYYYKHLSGWAESQGVRLPLVPNDCDQPYHLFYLLMPPDGGRDALIRHLKSHGVQSTFHYVPLHLSEMGRSFGGYDGQCPVTESVSNRLLRLPLYYGITEADMSHVVESVKKFCCADPAKGRRGAAAERAFRT